LLADNVIELLKEEVSSQEYDRYIKQLKFNEKASNSDQMVFVAPNILIANWVKTNTPKKLHTFLNSKPIKSPKLKSYSKSILKQQKLKQLLLKRLNQLKALKILY